MTKSRTISQIPSGNVSVANTINVGNVASGNYVSISANNILVGVGQSVRAEVNAYMINVQSIVANGSTGSNGQVLVSNGSGMYWGSLGLSSFYTNFNTNYPILPDSNNSVYFYFNTGTPYATTDNTTKTISFNQTGLTSAYSGQINLVSNTFTNISSNSGFRFKASGPVSISYNAGRIVYDTSASYSMAIRNMVYVLFSSSSSPSTFVTSNTYLVRGWVYKNNKASYPSSSTLSIKFQDCFVANTTNYGNNVLYNSIANMCDWQYFTNSVSTACSAITSYYVQGIELFFSSTNYDYPATIPNGTNNLPYILVSGSDNQLDRILLRQQASACNSPFIGSSPVSSATGLSNSTLSSPSITLSVGSDANFAYTVGDVLTFNYGLDGTNDTYINTINYP